MDELSIKNCSLVNEYQLSAAEERLLEVLLNPDNVGKNITEKCKLADISRTYYYELMEKPEFVKLYNKTAIELIKADLMPLMQTAIKEAKSGSFQHFKILMEMSGMYREKQDLNINTEDAIKMQIGRMPEEEIQNSIKQYLKDHPELVVNVEENK